MVHAKLVTLEMAWKYLDRAHAHCTLGICRPHLSYPKSSLYYVKFFR